MTRPRLIACLLWTLIASTPMAEEVREYRSGDSVDPREVAAILGRSPGDAPVMKMRSIRLLDGAASPAAATASALSLPVQFAFDSADILPAARQQLDALAEGIRLLPQTKPVVIEGHTDAVGSAEYNEQLSLRRANAVKRYLVATHSLDPERLRPVGVGERVPQPGRAPAAPENRRVQFRGD